MLKVIPIKQSSRSIMLMNS